MVEAERLAGLITSQIDTAPKHDAKKGSAALSLITSQIDTAPKLIDLGLVSQPV